MAVVVNSWMSGMEIGPEHPSPAMVAGSVRYPPTDERDGFRAQALARSLLYARHLPEGVIVGWWQCISVIAFRCWFRVSTP